jgi:DHA2 family multidrug resistance protein-like MFS transporter
VLRQRSLDDPLFDLRLFGNRAFTTAVIAMFGITSTGAVMLFMSQYMQLVLGLSPLHAGLWTLPGVVAMAISLMLSPVVAKTVRPAPLIAGGLVVSTIGALLMTQVTAGSGLPLIVIGFILFNSGCAPMVTLGSGIVVSSVVPEKAGSAAALSETSSEFGFALGIAALGSIVTAVYRTQIGGTLPAGIPDGAASGARDSLAGAAAASANLPADMGAALLSAAQQAFLSGMHVAAGICAAILLCVSLLAVTTLRNLRPLGETQAAAANAPEEQAVTG